MTTHARKSVRSVVVALTAALAFGSVGASAAVGGLATASAHARTTATHAHGPAGVRLAVCRRSPSLEQRVATVAAWMRPLPTGKRMALKIDLYQRAPAGRWSLRTDVVGLGSWISPSDPLLGTRSGDVFKYRQAVGRLVVPSSYRFRVSFRWFDAAGAVVREASATTAACRQPDLRPDLVLSDLQATPSPRGAGLVRYSVVVANRGRTPAPRFAVAATLPGDSAPLAHVRGVGSLAPGATAVVAFTGRGCAAGEAPALFAADPTNAIDEASEANNQLIARCPTS